MSDLFLVCGENDHKRDLWPAAVSAVAVNNEVINHCQKVSPFSGLSAETSLLS